MSKQYLGIDIGGTNIKYALMTEEAEILEQGEVPTDRGDFDNFRQSIVDIYDKYRGKVEALVFSAPGRIDASRAYFYTSGAVVCIGERDMAAALKDYIDVPISIENDAKAAALAELWKGSMKGVQNGVVLVLGTGIGGALIIDGKLYRGTTFAAGEVSPIATEWQKDYRESGHWSDYQSTTGLMRRYEAEIGAEKNSVNGRMFFEKVNNGDETAIAVLDEYCTHMASGLVSLQLVLDAEKYAFGGGISKQPVLIGTLRKKAEEAFSSNPYLPASMPEIEACTFGNDANLIGALYHYLYEVKQ